LYQSDNINIMVFLVVSIDAFRSKAKEAEAIAMGAKAIIPSGDADAMKEAAGDWGGGAEAR
jgi:hypothetical protein